MAIDNEWDPRLRQLGEYIRAQRQMADLSLRGLSQLTQVSNAYLSQIERGLHQPSLRVLESIAAALKLPSETLLFQAGVAPSSSATEGAVHADTETAIRTDPDLTPEAQATLITVYRSFKRPQARA